MTRAELQAKYPNASLAFIKLNADPETVGAIPTAVPQRRVQENSLVESPRKEGSPGGARFRLVVTSYRTRLTDADNLFPKFIIDALRYKGLIPDDSPEHIILEVRQEKVATKPQEGTLIEITPP